MLDEMIELLRREASAVEVVEARVRALELVVSSGQQRFVALACDELAAACEHLSSLELARTLALSAAGWPADATARDVQDSMGDWVEVYRLEVALIRLRDATRRLVAGCSEAAQALDGISGAVRMELDATGTMAGSTA